MKKVAGRAESANYLAYEKLQIIKISVLLGDYLLPVPLVDVDGVYIVKLFVAANSVHVGVKTVSY